MVGGLPGKLFLQMVGTQPGNKKQGIFFGRQTTRLFAFLLKCKAGDIKTLNVSLILFTVFMDIKQGSNMLTVKPEMLEMFGN